MDQSSTYAPMHPSRIVPSFGTGTADAKEFWTPEPRTPRGPSHLLMDETNTMILHALSYKGRMSLHEISEIVHRTESTVRDRVSNLERQGILLGYEARIDWARVGLPLEVILEASCAADKAVEVAKALQRMPNVVHAIVTTGCPNLLAVIKARDMADVHKLLAGLASAPLQDLQVRITMQELVAQRPPHAPPVSGHVAVRDLPARVASRLEAHGMQAIELEAVLAV